MTIPQAIYNQTKNFQKYSLEIFHGEEKTLIKMIVHDPRIITSQIPSTYPLLRQFLPTIFRCKCFNGANLAFSEEVQDTEVAHLFEHILLEYLCHAKVSSGVERITFKGETSWNWLMDPKGVFYIEIDAGHKDIFHFQTAMQKSVQLMNLIFA